MVVSANIGTKLAQPFPVSWSAKRWHFTALTGEFLREYSTEGEIAVPTLKESRDFASWFRRLMEADDERLRQFCTLVQKDQDEAWQFVQTELVAALLRDYKPTTRQQIIDAVKLYFQDVTSKALYWRAKVPPQADVKGLLVTQPHFSLPTRGGKRPQSKKDKQAQFLGAIEDFDALYPLFRTKLKKRFRNPTAKLSIVKAILRNHFRLQNSQLPGKVSQWASYPPRTLALKAAAWKHEVSANALNVSLTKYRKVRLLNESSLVDRELERLAPPTPNLRQWENRLRVLWAPPPAKNSDSPMPVNTPQ